ncbi:transcription elongation factor A 3-like isoform X16 [Labeo rohita]|uniref:Transcription elongation factor A 3-like isoform X16 n=1 Tax=Labeo rohita TaxID=84645 RepID=A0A498NIC8_LABRO|nr:transcription elongation factor A 3-like isoform X16 [Labeo rohita]RXN31642.1 transcription elongation factor A 3-like isoform X16 [Labeo rohita]
MSQIPKVDFEEYFHHEGGNNSCKPLKAVYDKSLPITMEPPKLLSKRPDFVSEFLEDGALDVLRELKDFNMTLKLLQDTRIGMSVNGIRKHCTDEDVVNLAKILIKNWKKLLESAQNQKSERSNEVKNGNHASKPPGSPNRTSPERQPRKDTQGSLQSPSLQSHPPHKRPFIDGKKERAKKAPDPNAPLPPLPFHLHPPQKREMKKERKETAEPSTPLPPVPLHLQPPTPTKRPSLDTKKDKEKERKDPADPKRRTSEHNEKDSKSKPETPKTPTTPTSPLSPSFSSSVGPLSPRLQTGDSIRDKCIEMLAAALRTDDDYKDYGTNCEGMAAEIEDYILSKHMC